MQGFSLPLVAEVIEAVPVGLGVLFAPDRSARVRRGCGRHGRHDGSCLCGLCGVACVSLFHVIDTGSVIQQDPWRRHSRGELGCTHIYPSLSSDAGYD